VTLSDGGDGGGVEDGGDLQGVDNTFLFTLHRAQTYFRCPWKVSISTPAQS
jgi:hypothetical protein